MQSRKGNRKKAPSKFQSPHKNSDINLGHLKTPNYCPRKISYANEALSPEIHVHAQPLDGRNNAYCLRKGSMSVNEPKGLGRKSSKEDRKIMMEFDIPQVEAEYLREKFLFFDRNKVGFVQKYQLPILFKSCGYKMTDEKIEKLEKFIKDADMVRIDLRNLFLAASFLKDLELIEDDDGDSEYLDAFVAMGGNYDKSGFIKKNTLIEIIKNQFELTIDIDDYMQGIGGEEEIDFSQFCILLDAGQNKNTSRISSFISQRGMSRAISFFDHLKSHEESDF